MTAAKSGKRILSGIQPTGNLHIGNYLGALRNWIAAQDHIGVDDTYLFMLADLHTMTVPFVAADLRHTSLDLTAWYLALGLDPKKVDIFLQSENPDHSYLAWIFNCITPVSWLERMTQYKDKGSKDGERASTGLLTYPTLMAADILLYDADEVPVGEDQAQHVEIARDIVERFKHLFGEMFTLPKFVTEKTLTRVMSLQDATKKMSKSDANQNGVIRLIDVPDVITQKIKRAETDSESEVRYDVNNKPAISNLLAIYAGFSGKSIQDIEKDYHGIGYAQFKTDLAEVVVNFLEPIQKEHARLMKDTGYIHTILDRGSEKARSISSKKILAVREVLGILR